MRISKSHAPRICGGTERRDSLPLNLSHGVQDTIKDRGFVAFLGSVIVQIPLILAKVFRVAKGE